MIEANNPEINVDELMQKIRDEVANRRVSLQQISITYKPQPSNLMEKYNSFFNHIEVFLKNAEFRAYARTKWPDNLNKFPFNFIPQIPKIILKILNFLFKDQREVNFNLLQALKESVELNRQLVEQITTLKAQIDERLEVVDSRVQSMNERLGAGAVDSHVQSMNERLEAVNSRIQGLDERLEAVDNRLPKIDDSFNKIETSTNNWITYLQERLDAANNRDKTINEHLKAVDTRIQKMDESYIRNDSYLKNDLAQQKRLISLFLEQAQQRLSKPFNQEELQALIDEEKHSLDAFYVAFEDQFRGSREDIFNRFKVYLPLIEQAKIGTPDLPILDVGCGRGEWLELLRESGYTAKGIDINRVMLEQCRVRELEVMESDVIAYLQSLPDASLGAVTGFHIIEHLQFEELIKLFDESVRVLSPGGLAIFETPNPENVLVGSYTFYLDPTHRNPLPSPMIKFIAESRGLSKVSIMNLHPYPENFRFTGSELAEKFSDYFYGSQDYGVIGYKP